MTVKTIFKETLFQNIFISVSTESYIMTTQTTNQNVRQKPTVKQQTPMVTVHRSLIIPIPILRNNHMIFDIFDV